MNNNYYEYCKAISKSYYPRIYKDLNESIEQVLKSKDKDNLHPFPHQNTFEDLVNEIFLNYRKIIYQEMIEGRISCANYSDNNVIRIVKDLISILLIQKILKDREHFKDYPYYY